MIISIAHTDGIRLEIHQYLCRAVRIMNTIFATLMHNMLDLRCVFRAILNPRAHIIIIIIIQGVCLLYKLWCFLFVLVIFCCCSSSLGLPFPFHPTHHRFCLCNVFLCAICVRFREHDVTASPIRSI